MEEAFPLLRRLWAGETVDHHGAVGEFDGVTLAPLPVQDPLEFWTGGMVPAALERCGRFADGWLPVRLHAGRGRRRQGGHRRGGGGRRTGHQPRALRGLPRLRAGPARARRCWPPSDGPRKGVDPATVVPAGLDGLRGFLESFLEVGFSKFVVRPLARPESWRAELEALAAAVGDLQT